MFDQYWLPKYTWLWLSCYQYNCKWRNDFVICFHFEICWRNNYLCLNFFVQLNPKFCKLLSLIFYTRWKLKIKLISYWPSRTFTFVALCTIVNKLRLIIFIFDVSISIIKQKYEKCRFIKEFITIFSIFFCKRAHNCQKTNYKWN